jgi:hypothetical protein
MARRPHWREGALPLVLLGVHPFLGAVRPCLVGVLADRVPRLLQGISGGLLTPMAQRMVARAAGRHMARVAACEPVKSVP